MKSPRWMAKSGLFPVVLGLTDGILSALTLTAGRLTNPDHPVTMSLVIRVSLVAFTTGAFVFLVAEYSRLRRELIHAERELNLLSHGHMATGRLGRQIWVESLWASAVSSVSSFFGSLIPLIAGVLFSGARWASVGTALAALAALGVGLARTFHGHAIWWSACLVLGGVALSVVGVWLAIV